MNPVQRCRKAKRPGSAGGFGIRVLQNLCDPRTRIGKSPAFDGFHDHDLHPVFLCGFIAFFRIDVGIVPVGVVDLKLDEIRFRMFSEQIIQHLRRGVKGETDIADQPFFLLLFQKLKEMPVFVSLHIGDLHAMEKIVVDPAGFQPRKRGVKLLFCLFLTGCFSGIDLGGDGKCTAGIPLYHRIPQGGFAVSVLSVGIGGIEIGASVLHKAIHQLIEKFHIHASLFKPGDAHKSKAQFHFFPFRSGSDPLAQKAEHLPYPVRCESSMHLAMRALTISISGYGLGIKSIAPIFRHSSSAF